MLKPFGREHSAQALDLLDEGFPERGRAFWENSLARLLEWPGNREVNYPPGYFLLEQDEAVGIVLTPASRRLGDDGAHSVIVNVASWYVRPQHRWKAPMMLRSLVRDEGVIFTDLTPTPDVQKMLAALGFEQMSQGIEWIATPIEALRTSFGHLRPWDPDDSLGAGSPRANLIAWHKQIGCTALVLEWKAQRHLVVLKPMRHRGLPAAHVLFAGSREALEESLPALARHMLARGCLLLRIDARREPKRGRSFRSHGIWFARGGAFEDRTDHFGSELALFDF